MKKIFALMITLFIVAACGGDTGSYKEKDDNFGYDLPKAHVYEAITPEEYDKKIDSGEDMFIVFGRIT